MFYKGLNTVILPLNIHTPWVFTVAALLYMSPSSHAQREIPLMVNNKPIEVYVNYPTEAGEVSELVDGITLTSAPVDAKLKNYLLGHFPQYYFPDTFKKGSIPENNITIGTSTLRNIFSVATALHRDDLIVAQNETYEIDFYSLFLDEHKPSLLFSDEGTGVASVFEGDAQIDPLFLSRTLWFHPTSTPLA